MRLYLSKGRVWTGTQADAKAAQGGTNNYETVEVPDAKPARLAWLNEMWALFAGEAPAPVAPEPAVGLPDAPEGMEWRLALQTQFGGTERRSQWQPGVNECLSCHRTRKGAEMTGQIMAKDQIVDALYGITDQRHLDELEALIADRRRELNPVQPVARVRQRTRVPAPEEVPA